MKRECIYRLAKKGRMEALKKWVRSVSHCGSKALGNYPSGVFAVKEAKPLRAMKKQKKSGAKIENTWKEFYADRAKRCRGPENSGAVVGLISIPP